MKPKAWIVASLVSLVVGVSAPAGAQEHTKESLDEVKQKVDKKEAVLIDVREPEEWREGHVEGAILVPLSQLRKGQNSKEYVAELGKKLPKDKVLYCHCRAGFRALAGAKILHDLKYDARALKPGYDEILKAGFPQANDQAEKQP